MQDHWTLPTVATATDDEQLFAGALLVALLTSAAMDQTVGYDRLVPIAHRLSTDPDCPQRIKALSAALPAHFAVARGWFSPNLRKVTQFAVGQKLLEVRHGHVKLGSGAPAMLAEFDLQRNEAAVLARACGRLSVSA